MFFISFEEDLANFLEGYEKLLILGVGNELRQDDGFGSYFVRLFSEAKSEKVSLIDTGTVPESFTGKIKKEKPSHIIILDAVFMNRNPGEIAIINKDQIANLNLTTHSMSLRTFIKYLEVFNSFEIILIGVQPKFMNFGMELSDEVLETSQYLKNILLEYI